MKIKNISCTQFAGINNRDVAFSDGLNVVYGKNESGKSTLVNLISRTLFQDAKLDKRSDRDFMNLYFPGQTKGDKVAGDFVDGTIVLEGEDGTYTISKEWGDDPRCTLSTPSGIVRDQDTINDILSQLLQYGEGVYSDMLFSSQRNTDASLQTILDASKKTDASKKSDTSKKVDVKKAIIDAVSKAFVESNGASIDVIEQRIDESINNLEKYWDTDRNAPVPKKSGKGDRENGIGEILKKYLALSKAKEQRNKIEALESELDKAIREFNEAEEDVRSAEEAYNTFSKYSGKLAARKAKEQLIKQAEGNIDKLRKDLADWAKCDKNLKIARPLQAEKKNREIEDKYRKAKEFRDEIAINEKSISGKNCPEDDEIARAEKAEREIQRLENKLRGMNITAAIQMLNGNNIEIVSVRTGKPLDLTDGIADINEAVIVRIPGVMEMQLSPADVDAESVKGEIIKREKILKDICAKYDVDSVNALKKLSKEITTVKNDIELSENKLNIILNGTSYEELKESADKIVDEPRAKDEIDKEISSLCKGGNVDNYISREEGNFDRYKNDYTSVEDLKNRISINEKELEKMKISLDELKDIPGEYLKIGDPEKRLKELQDDFKEAQECYNDSLAQKSKCSTKLESYKDSLPNDPAEEVEKAEREFNEAKDLLNHWLHIKEVFIELKESIKNNPMKDIADSFAHYLSVISDGRVSTELPDADKLNIEIFSSDKLLDYGKLSEGTKETVSLAFRLAVLDHLFPDGGVIVFDDPFTDMDDDRTKQSCALIKECAARHQVIFLTCKEECAEMLGSNMIRI